MGLDAPPKKPHKHRSIDNWTAFDRDLIAAARDRVEVSLWLSSSDFLADARNTQDSVFSIDCVIVQVDRYFLKVKIDLLDYWIAKSCIAGVYLDG